jgi:hypothetical protein
MQRSLSEIELWEDEKREGEGGRRGNSVPLYLHFNFFALSDRQKVV